jgi:uncharacterized protein (PEP-CTERM system associated)
MLSAPAPLFMRAAVSSLVFTFVFTITVTSPGSSWAGEWDLSASISAQETFTDNAGLATQDEDRNSDLITQITPKISLSGRGGRGRLAFDYGLDKSMYRLDSSRDSTNNNLAATGQVEVWNQVAFIDASASIAQQVVNDDAATSNSVAGQNINRTETKSFNISPFFLHHFGTWVETESRISLGGVRTGLDSIDDTTTVSEQFRINSGRRFTVLQWSVDVLNQNIKNSGSAPTKSTRRVDSNFTYVVNRHWSLLAGLGYEDIEDSTLDSNLKGATWNVGFTARPSRRTDFRFTIGERNDTTTIDFQGSHQLSKRTTINASFSETIETSQQLLSDNLSFIGTDPITGGVIDTRTGLPFAGSDDTFGLQDNSFRKKRFDLSLNGSRRRNTFNGGVFWESRDTEATNIEEIAIGANVGLGRKLSRRTNGNLNFTYRNTDFGTSDNKTENEYLFSAGMSYQIFGDLKATANYNLTYRNVNNARDDLMENAITVGLQKSF